MLRRDAAKVLRERCRERLRVRKYSARDVLFPPRQPHRRQLSAKRDFGDKRFMHDEALVSVERTMIRPGLFDGLTGSGTSSHSPPKATRGLSVKPSSGCVKPLLANLFGHDAVRNSVRPRDQPRTNPGPETTI